MNGLIVIHGREKVRKRDTLRTEVGQCGKCEHKGIEKWLPALR